MEKYFNRGLTSVILEHLYMDNNISGAQTKYDLLNFFLCILLNKGGFNFS